MTTTAIPAEAFEHGDPRRYRRGCHCTDCVAGVTAEARRRRYLRQTGRSTRRTADKARAHITQLRAADMDDSSIRAAARISRDTLYRIMRDASSIHVATEKRILAVPVPSSPTEKQGSGAYTDSTTTRLILQYLMHRGWPSTFLGRRLDKHKQWVLYLANTPGNVRIGTANEIRALYHELADKRPEDHGVTVHNANRARAAAAAKGWGGIRPLVAGTPQGVTVYWRQPEPEPQRQVDPVAIDRVRSGERLKLHHDDAREASRLLTSDGVSAKTIASRVGVADRTVTRWRREDQQTSNYPQQKGA